MVGNKTLTANSIFSYAFSVLFFPFITKNIKRFPILKRHVSTRPLQWFLVVSPFSKPKLARPLHTERTDCNPDRFTNISGLGQDNSTTFQPTRLLYSFVFSPFINEAIPWLLIEKGQLLSWYSLSTMMVHFLHYHRFFSKRLRRVRVNATAKKIYLIAQHEL